MLTLLRQNPDIKKILLDQAFFADRNWFNMFLKSYNGVTYHNTSQVDVQVYLDASLNGLGGAYNSMIYAVPIERGYMDYTIVHLEILNILVACKIWASQW